jgi:hypothetical protein
MRRVRLRLDHTVDERIEFRSMFDFVSGTNQNTAELKDALVIGKLGPNANKNLTVGYVGQMLLPIGNDIPASQSNYEFAERALYNISQFNGYRSRGFYVDQKLGKDFTASAGLFDSLGILDTEQRNRVQAAGGRLAEYGGLRYHHGDLDLGVTGVAGERPDLDTGAGKLPSTPREFLYLHAGTHLGSKLSLRGEIMKGKDRVPGSGVAAATNMTGYYGLASLRLGAHDDFNVRYQMFDRNTNRKGDSIEAYGASLRHSFTNAVMLMLAYERFQENARVGTADKKPYGQLTARLQVRF